MMMMMMMTVMSEDDDDDEDEKSTNVLYLKRIEDIKVTMMTMMMIITMKNQRTRLPEKDGRR